MLSWVSDQMGLRRCFVRVVLVLLGLLSGDTLALSHEVGATPRSTDSLTLTLYVKTSEFRSWMPENQRITDRGGIRV